MHRFRQVRRCLLEHSQRERIHLRDKEDLQVNDKIIQHARAIYELAEDPLQTRTPKHSATLQSFLRLVSHIPHDGVCLRWHSDVEAKRGIILREPICGSGIGSYQLHASK